MDGQVLPEVLVVGDGNATGNAREDARRPPGVAHPGAPVPEHVGRALAGACERGAADAERLVTRPVVDRAEHVELRVQDGRMVERRLGDAEQQVGVALGRGGRRRHPRDTRADEVVVQQAGIHGQLQVEDETVAAPVRHHAARPECDPPVGSAGRVVEGLFLRGERQEEEGRAPRVHRFADHERSGRVREAGSVRSKVRAIDGLGAEQSIREDPEQASAEDRRGPAIPYAHARRTTQWAQLTNGGDLQGPLEGRGDGGRRIASARLRQCAQEQESDPPDHGAQDCRGGMPVWSQSEVPTKGRSGAPARNRRHGLVRILTQDREPPPRTRAAGTP